MIRLCFTIFMMGSLLVDAQDLLQGKITDIQGVPLPGAHIKMDDSLTTVSDLDGQFLLDGLTRGTHFLEIRALGYLTYSDTILLNSDLDVTIQLEEQLYDLQVVKLSASWIKPGQPFTYAQMSKDQIKSQNFGRDMPYLLQTLPSTVVTSDAGTGIGYTGIRVRGSDPTRINVTLDGVPINDAESQGVFWVDLPDLASNAGAIQVQRGVGTSTNGAGAFGATINVKTSGLEDQMYGIVDLTAGSFNTLRANAKFGTGLIDKHFSLQGSFSHIQSDGYIDRASADLNSIYLSGTVLGRNSSFKVNFLKGKEVTYQAWNGVPSQYVSDPLLRTYNTAGLKSDGTFYDNEVDDYGQTHLHGIFHKQWNDLSLQTTFHYTHGAGFYEQYRSDETISDYGFEDLSGTDDLIRRRWLDNDFYGAIFNLQRSKPQSVYSFGGGGNIYQGDHFGEVIWLAGRGDIDPQEYYRNDAVKYDVNLYNQYQYLFAGDWTVFADMQWRMVSYKFEGFNASQDVADQSVIQHFFNPKFGVEKKINQLTTYYSVGVAHREPNRDDYVQSTPQSRPRPERLIDHELGARFSADKIIMSLNLFYMDYKDQLVLTGAINDVGEYNRVNVDQSYRTGLEYSLSFQFNRNLTLGGSFTWNKSRIKSLTEAIDNWDTGKQVIEEHRNVPISFSPEILTSALIDLTVLKKKRMDLKLRTDYRFVGKQYLDNTGDDLSALSSYQQTDLGVFMNWYLPFLDQITFKCQVINLFDKSFVNNGWVYRYISAGYDATPDDPHASHIGGDTYTLSGFYPQAGLHVLFGITVNF